MTTIHSPCVCSNPAVEVHRLLAQVWEYEYPGETRTVDVHIRRLRQKLGEAAKDWIETVVGVGYRFRGGS